MAKRGSDPIILHRTLGAAEAPMPGITRLLDTVLCTDGRMRAFFGTGTPPAVFATEAPPDCAQIQELRDVSGGTLAIFDRAAPVALADGGRLTLTATPAETAALAGRNVTMGFRLEETAAQVAEGLRYHAASHGLTGALIVNRLPGDNSAAFATALEAALDGTALTVVVLDAPLPLGKPDMPPENHPILAPDAPGKDRMDHPAPDRWRAPIGEGLIYEIGKWRFLAEARAVLMLDVADILAPRDEGAPTAFDLCTTTRTGVIALQGARIYPWRVREDQAARFGDHICRPFDKGEDMARWGCAPAQAGLGNTWRRRRVAYARSDTASPPLFYRAMAIQVPGRSAAELVPKTSLVEDATLLALAEGAFQWKPVRAPVSAPKAAPARAVQAGRTAIITTMKNEGPFILEWLAYHRAIGVDDFLIYTNDCTDGTDTMLQMLQAKGFVQHRENPFRESGLKPQHAALQAAESEPIMQTCGWGICMDVDEFIDIKVGDGTLAALYARIDAEKPGTNLISLTWRLFGNADVHGYEDRFLIEQFDRCAPELIRKPHQAWGFKTLYRNIDIFKKLGVHRPKGLIPDLWDQVRWLNGSGRDMPRTMFRNGWRSTTDTYGYDWVQLNHYAVRSAESFLVKRDRGRVNHVDRDQGLNYWFRMNHNVDEDRSIQRMIPPTRAEFDRLMADPDIAAAHHHSVACHRDKITELRATENYENFYAELTGARMERLCRLQKHFGSAVFNTGPHVIPPDLHERDLADDFFFTVEAADEAVH